jgi:hypothetical protein
LLRDDVQLTVDSYAAFKSPLYDKKIRPIATSAAKQPEILPNVPPAKEQWDRRL